MRGDAHEKITASLGKYDWGFDLAKEPSTMLCGLYKLQPDGEYKFVSILEFAKPEDVDVENKGGKE